jgi:hypothetical protein
MENQRKIKIKAKDKDLKGAYSNLMQVLHTKEEFILDFFLVSPPEGVLVSRVIVSPTHFKRITRAFQENLQKYEQKFGKIEAEEIPQTPIGFKTS